MRRCFRFRNRRRLLGGPWTVRPGAGEGAATAVAVAKNRANLARGLNFKTSIRQLSSCGGNGDGQAYGGGNNVRQKYFARCLPL